MVTAQGLDDVNNTFTHFINDPADPQSISHIDIRCITEDRSGIIWIGTRGGGVNKLDLKPEKFKVFRHNPYDADSLSDNRVWSIYEDKDLTAAGMLAHTVIPAYNPR